MEANREALPGPWAGKTIFYKLACHGDNESEEALIDSLIAALQEELYFKVGDDEVTAEHDAPEDEATDVQQLSAELLMCDEPESEEDGLADTMVSLVHDAGLGAVDTGCGRGLVGEATLQVTWTS